MEKKQYEELKKLVQKYSTHYYTYDETLIPDDEWDQMYRQLLDAEKIHPEWITSDSPTQRVGGKLLEGFEKKEHTRELYSLSKQQNLEEYFKWYQDVYAVLRRPFHMTLELKFDGLTIIVRYEKGVLAEIRTRGNGVIGEVITATGKTIRSIPLRIPYFGVVEFQGEGYMPTDKMSAYNRKKLPEFHKAIEKLDHEPTPEEIKKLRKKYFIDNERNGASGSLRNHDPKITSERNLDAFFYNVAYIDDESQVSSQSEMMSFIQEQGLKTNPYFHKTDDPKEIAKKLEDIETNLRQTLNYAIDGAVIKVDELALRNPVGYTSKYPKWATAFKFKADQVGTPLLQVKNQVGRTGKITPVGIVEPVNLGTEVSRATLNNYDDIKRKGVRIGVRVRIRRSNDVIPEIIGVIDENETGKEIIAPTHCPECGTELVKDGEGVDLFCPNLEACPAQQIGRFIHFASRDAMNIDGFGGETAALLYEEGIVKNLIDLYQLKTNQMIGLPGFAKRKSEKLIQAIVDSKKKPLSAFVYALGIRHVGKKTSEEIVNHFETIEKLQSATEEELKEIDDVGPVVAKSVYRYFHDFKNLHTLKELQLLGVEMKHQPRVLQSSQFEGQTFVITGEMPSGRKRKEIENLIKAQGGRTSGSVSAKTNYVVYGEKAGSKLTKAQDLNREGANIHLLTEDEFEKLIDK